jgi:glycosyltransferase involved in cell wall biosynthesis
MRILYFIGSYTPGIGSTALHEDFVRALGDRGHEVTVASFDPARRGGPFVGEVPAVGYRLLHIACSRGPRERALNAISNRIFRYPFFLSGVAGYRQIVRAVPAEVVHAETVFPLGAITAFPGAPHRPQVLTPQGEDLIVEPSYDYGHRRFAVARALVRLSLRRAEVIRCIAPVMEEIVKDAGGAGDRCAVVPCNVRSDAVPDDLGGFRKAARAEIRRRFALPSERPLVLAFGRLHPFKGIDLLIRAIAVLRKGGFTGQAAIFGAGRRTPRFGDYQEFLARIVAEEGLTDEVRFCGEVPNDDAARVLAAADVLVVPSTTESFNRVTVEAAAVGTPVVVTSTTGIAAFLEEEPWAVVVRRRDPSTLAAAISRALGGNRDAAMARGPAFARRFLPAPIAREMEALYRRAVAKAS